MPIYVVAIRELSSGFDNYSEIIGYHETEEDAHRTIDLMKHDQKLLFDIHRNRMPGLDMPVCDYGTQWWKQCKESYEIVTLKVPRAPVVQDENALEKAKADLDARRRDDLARVLNERMSLMEAKMRKIEEDITKEKQRRDVLEYHR